MTNKAGGKWEMGLGCNPVLCAAHYNGQAGYNAERRGFLLSLRWRRCEENDECYYPRADVITPAKDKSAAGSRWGV